MSLSYVQCFLYILSSSINVSIFHITWLDTFWTDYIYMYICIYTYTYIHIRICIHMHLDLDGFIVNISRRLRNSGFHLGIGFFFNICLSGYSV